MGIRALDNSRTADRMEFMAPADNLIKEVTAWKDSFKTSLEKQATHSNELVKETHNAYESTIVVLQSTINGLRQSLTTNSSVDKILRLTKEIYTLVFNTKIPNNVQVSNLIKYQFNETFSKIDGLNIGLRNNIWMFPQNGEVSPLCILIRIFIKAIRINLLQEIQFIRGL